MGTAGQVLTSNGPGVDPTFQTAAGGGSLSVTTKGDLQGFSTVAARVPVGTDGSVLSAASGQALGVQYVTALGLTSTFTFGSASSSTGGLLLQNNTGSYSASTLNYYEDYSTTISFSAVSNATMNIRRVGRLVTVSIGDISFTTGGSLATIQAASAVPSRFVPGFLYIGGARVQNGGTFNTSPGMVLYYTSGTIEVYTSYANAPTSWSGVCSVNAFSYSYAV